MTTADSLVSELQATGYEIEELIRSAGSSESLYRSPAPGAWSARDVVCHLVDTERLIFRLRLSTLLKERNPFFPDINHEPWVQEHGYAMQHPTDKLKEFAEERLRTVELVRQATPDQWEARGVHELRGEVTFLEVAESCVNHTRVHADQIRRALHLARS